MVLLSGMMRTAAVWGTHRHPRHTVRGASGRALGAADGSSGHPDRQRTTLEDRAAPADPAEALRELTDLHERGVVTDAEFDALRGRLRV